MQIRAALVPAIVNSMSVLPHQITPARKRDQAMLTQRLSNIKDFQISNYQRQSMFNRYRRSKRILQVALNIIAANAYSIQDLILKRFLKRLHFSILVMILTQPVLLSRHNKRQLSN
jgi:hypothetical protein